MNDDALVTGEMVGLFFVFGFDVVLLVGVLWVFEYVSTTVLASVTLFVAAVFGGWVVLRWLRIRSDSSATAGSKVGTQGEGSEFASIEDPETEPIEALKRRYARDELSEDEFEDQLDDLLTDRDGAVECETERSDYI